MKCFLLPLYTVYFTLLMIVPCNHVDSCTHLIQDLLGENQHSHHHHSNSPSPHHSNNESDDSQENNLHHHACVHVVLDTPPSGRCFFVGANNSFYSSFIATQPKTWTSPNEFGCLTFSDIWHPPQSFSC